jgi:undecaprenyl-diphosphatase
MKKFSGLLALILFCLLSYLVISKSPFILKSDATVGNFFKILENKNATLFFKTAATIFKPIWVIIYGTMVIIFLSHCNARHFLPPLSILLSGYLVMEFLKWLIKRPRPTEPLVYAWGSSYPSAHTFEIVLLSLILISYLRKRKFSFYQLGEIIIFLIMMIVIISRLYLRAHFLSDIIGAILLAVIWFDFSLIIQTKIKTKKS